MRGIDPVDRKRVERFLRNGLSIREAAKHSRISKNTVLKIAREQREETSRAGGRRQIVQE